MIISHSHKYVYVSVPKAGTHTMYRLLREKYDGEHLGILEGRKTMSPHHMRHIPGGCESYFKFTSVRNPFSRAVSLWWTITQTNVPGTKYRDTYLPMIGGESFVEFARWNLKWETNGSGRIWFFMPQHRWLETVKRFDALLHMEKMLEEFNALRFVEKPLEQLAPVMERRHDRAPWWEHYDHEAISLVRMWAGPDFKAYGYPADFERAKELGNI
ncbi:MAG TPA: sulfotransferase family 2 domain-containing protein [Planctomycetota bacterium]|nr:sulfotransferase family 2 domain-containing protein [Planctomycetota bacterium]